MHRKRARCHDHHHGHEGPGPDQPRRRPPVAQPPPHGRVFGPRVASDHLVQAGRDARMTGVLGVEVSRSTVLRLAHGRSVSISRRRSRDGTTGLSWGMRLRAGRSTCCPTGAAGERSGLPGPGSEHAIPPWTTSIRIGDLWEEIKEQSYPDGYSSVRGSRLRQPEPTRHTPASRRPPAIRPRRQPLLDPHLSRSLNRERRDPAQGRTGRLPWTPPQRCLLYP